MPPFSVLLYYNRNKIKLAPVFIVLALAVFGISLIGVLTGSIMDSTMQKVEVYRDAAQISPSYRKGHNTIDAAVKGDLYRDESIYALYPDIRLSTYQPHLAGQTSAHIYAVEEHVYPLIMERYELALSEGRLPQPGMPEIAIHEVVAKGRGLQIGSALDPKQDRQESLPVRFEIVGILRGPTVLSLASLEFVSRRTEFRAYARSLLAFPDPVQLSEFERMMNMLNPDLVRVFTYAVEMARYQSDFAALDGVVWSINAVVVTVLSLLVGLLNLIYFLDRMNEFGLLLGIGYPRSFVIRRAMIESLVLTMIAWVFGLLFSQLVYSMLNGFYFEPNGMALSGMNWRTIQFTLPVPIIVSLFAAGTVISQLRKFDPISIIERRD